MKLPIITVLLPVYNAALYLKEAIRSILNQTFTDFELLIINDGSTDKSAEIIKTFKDNRIKIIQNDVNIGLIQTLNKGIKLARGKYLARMDADDIAMPKRLEKQVFFLENNPQFALVGSQANIIYNERKTSRKYNMETKSQLIPLLSFFFCPFLHPSVLIKKSVLNEFQYDNNFTIAEDYHLWIRILNKYPCANLKESLLYYREHSNNISNLRKKDKLDSIKKIYHLNLKSVGLKCTNTELDTYLKISDGYKTPITLSEFKEIKNWLIKLQQHLLSVEQFEEDIVKKVFGRVWYRIHRKNTSQGMRIFFQYLTNRQGLKANIRLQYVAFLFIKCLLKK
jgi:glycosyltransferase involved in cell wall biosynthesis